MTHRQLCVTIPLLLSYLACLSQDATVTFEPGNNRKVSYSSECANGYVKQGKDLYFIIVNPNPLLYQFSVTKTSSVLFINPNSAVTNYVTLDQTNISPAGKPGAGTPAKATGATHPNALPTEVLDAKLAQLTPLINDFITAETSLSADITTFKAYYNSLVNFNGQVSDWKNQPVLTEDVTKAGISDMENGLKGIIKTFYIKHKNSINPYTPDNESTDYKLTYQTTTGFPSKLIDQIAQDLDDYDKAYDALNAFVVANKEIMTGLVASSNYLAKNFKIDLFDLPAFTAKKQDIDTKAQKLVSDYNATLNTSITNLASSISTVKNLSFSSTFGPFTIKDEDEILLKVAQLNNKSNNDELKDFDGITIHRKGGLKIDFSAGLFGSGLYDEAYVTSQSTAIVKDSTVSNGAVSVGPTQTTYSKIIARGGSHFSFGPMAFIHFHSKRGKAWDYGGFFGSGFLFKDNSKPVISVGLNAITGPYQRLVIGLGVAMAPVTRLSSKYQEGQTYRETITDVPTESQLKLSWLFSLSWNLSK